jgi:hypothetical protein
MLLLLFVSLVPSAALKGERAVTAAYYFTMQSVAVYEHVLVLMPPLSLYESIALCTWSAFDF